MTLVSESARPAVSRSLLSCPLGTLSRVTMPSAPSHLPTDGAPRSFERKFSRAYRAAEFASRRAAAA
jgi:hypothetical protein